MRGFIGIDIMCVGLFLVFLLGLGLVGVCFSVLVMCVSVGCIICDRDLMLWLFDCVGVGFDEVLLWC